MKTISLQWATFWPCVFRLNQTFNLPEILFKSINNSISNHYTVGNSPEILWNFFWNSLKFPLGNSTLCLNSPFLLQSHLEADSRGGVSVSYHFHNKLPGLHNRDPFLYSSGGWKTKVNMKAGLYSIPSGGFRRESVSFACPSF